MKIEFHYDFGSPNAYLVHKVIPAVTKQTGIEFDYVPILLGGVFKATNNVSPAVSLQGIKNKPDYARTANRGPQIGDRPRLIRFALRCGVEYQKEKQVGRRCWRQAINRGLSPIDTIVVCPL